MFQYAYNAAGQIVSESDDSLGQVANLSSSNTYTYDSQGRETSATESSTGGPTVVLTYQYTGDATQPATVSATIDGVADYQDTYTYNAQGQVTSITQTGQSGGDAVAAISVTLSYDASGNLTNLTRSVNGQTAVSADYSYDSQNDLTGLVYWQGSTDLASYSYTYPTAGVPASAGSSQSLIPNPQSLLSSATTPDGTVNYTYDADGQLTGATYSNPQSLIPNPSESYTYDANGNRTGGGYVTGADNELLSDGTYNYQYDADGNRIERTDIATGAVTDYVWDNRDRLVEVIDRTSAGGAITEDVHYFYDVQNRWIGETISVPAQAVQETSFAYNGNQIVLQFDGTQTSPLPSGEGQGEGGFASPLTAANLSHRYLWGPAVDQILAGETVTSLTQPGNVLLPLTNNEGTVCDLAQFNAGTGTTTVVDHRIYDSFGNLVSQTNAAVDFVFGFTGLPTDAATGDVVALNRIYDPATGTWMSKDPTGVVAGDANAYRYCGNSPATDVDLWGLADQSVPPIVSVAIEWCLTGGSILGSGADPLLTATSARVNALIAQGYSEKDARALTAAELMTRYYPSVAAQQAQNSLPREPLWQIGPAYSDYQAAQAHYLAGLLSKGEIAAAWAVPGGIGENLLVALGAPGFPILCPPDPAPGLSVYESVPPGPVAAEVIPPGQLPTPAPVAQPLGSLEFESCVREELGGSKGRVSYGTGDVEVDVITNDYLTQVKHITNPESSVGPDITSQIQKTAAAAMKSGKGLRVAVSSTTPDSFIEQIRNISIPEQVKGGSARRS